MHCFLVVEAVQFQLCCLQSIDDQIMCMVGMGFELEDCQAAVENGKLCVDEAVDWLVVRA